VVAIFSGRYRYLSLSDLNVDGENGRASSSCKVAHLEIYTRKTGEKGKRVQGKCFERNINSKNFSNSL